MKADAFLFDMRGGMQFNPANDRGFVSDKPFCGKNPTYGAADQLLPVEAADQRGAADSGCRGHAGARDHRQRSARCARRRHQSRLLGSAASAAAALSPASRPGVVAVAAALAAAANNGPNVMPGDYRVTLVVDGKDVATKTVRVSGDKDMPMTDADRKTWHDTSLDLHEMQRVANAAAEAVTTLATSVDGR